MQILCKLYPTPGGQERKDPARAHRAEEGRFCHTAQARQTVFLLPEPCGGQARLSAALPCDDLRQTPVSGPQDPSLPEVKDPRGSAVASSLRAPPSIHTPHPARDPAEGGRQEGRGLGAQQRFVPRQHLRTRSLSRSWRAPEPAASGCDEGVGTRRGGGSRGPHRREESQGQGVMGLRLTQAQA